jgi:DNA-binding transcriptional regulator YdaS (Cro superfamily)
MKSGTRKPTPEMTKNLEKITGGKVSRFILRPDIWET